MKKLSLHLRLALSFLCLTILVWLASAVLSWHETKEQMDEFFDTYQLSLAKQLASADWSDISPETQKKTNQLIKNLDDDGEEEDEALGFAVFSKKGEMIFNDGENGMNFHFSPVSGFDNQHIGHKKKNLWRMLWIETIDKKFYIVVGQELDFRQEASLEMVFQSLTPWSIGLLILILLSLGVIYQELKPIKSITKNLSQRNANDFSEITMENVPNEISPLIKAINTLFIRIDKMLKKERSFISDAAHELRSPLAALKIQLEVALLAEDDKKMRLHAFEKLSEGIERSSHLVEQLLALSKVEAKEKEIIELEKIEWKKVIQSLVEEYNSKIKTKNLKININISEKSPIEFGNPLLCTLLFRNLLDNAIRYCPSNSEILIDINETRILIENIAHLEEKNIDKLGERFYRPAGQTENGSGLGLSIVSKISEIHNVLLKYEYKNDKFCIKLEKD
ncbi:MAG: histidine kinase dimerization/phospho-acceptor domain-containing protein [Alphaproteobacteria bacterium]